MQKYATWINDYLSTGSLHSKKIMQLFINIAGVTPTGDSEKSILSNSENKNPSSWKNIQFYIKLYIEFKSSNAYWNGN